MTSYSQNLSSGNISYYTIPVMWVVSVLPRLYAASLYQSKAKKFMDIRSPRDMPNTIANDKLFDKATKDRISRAEAAQANGFENLTLYAAAVMAGNAARLGPKLLNSLSIAYLVSRLAYNYIYINNTTRGMAMLRSVAFFAGLAINMTLFIKAGQKMSESLV